MAKEIDGKKYELADQTEEEAAHIHACKGCVGYWKEEIVDCLKFGDDCITDLASVGKVWKLIEG